MEKEAFIQLLNSSPALQMLRLRNMHWVLPFLYDVFKISEQFTITESRLVSLLAETLSVQEAGLEDLEEAKITFGEDDESRSRKYILSWVQKRILQDLPDAEGNTHYQLSAYTEKVFQWIQTLQVRQHVGTESRFLLLFSSLRDIVENTDDDRVKRLEVLKNRKAEIEKEIRAVELGAKPSGYENAQVQERLELFTRLCYELIGDFREVEDNFKQIHRSIVERHTRAEQHKGAIVGFAFEAYDALRNSNQGKSFYAFWDFLMSRPGQEDWKKLTEQLIVLLQDREIQADGAFLQNVKSMLLQQGRTVYDANDKMAEKLSRIITEKEMAQHQRLRRQINGIKELVFDLKDRVDVQVKMELDDSAEIRIAMDRRLTLEKKNAPAEVRQPMAAVERIEDPQRFSRLLNNTHINKKQLWQKVEIALQQKSTASLKEVLEITAPEHGLAEVVGYYDFLRDRSNRVQVIPGTIELIPLDKEGAKYIEVPYLLFAK